MVHRLDHADSFAARDQRRGQNRIGGHASDTVHFGIETRIAARLVDSLRTAALEDRTCDSAIRWEALPGQPGANLWIGL